MPEATTRGLPSEQDPRFRRSRESIIVALRDTARSGRPVTVSSVSSAAGVTRATFYNHFQTLEEAAWLALLDSFGQLLAVDIDKRRRGAAAELVGVQSLRKLVELLRVDAELARLAEAHRERSVLPGLAGIVLEQVHRFRAEFSAPADADADAEDVYVAAGLYALIATGARGDREAADVASTAYSMLPEWMRRPQAKGAPLVGSGPQDRPCLPGTTEGAH